ncbi:MAG: S-layer homology domain-containing protein [Clostridiales bacterium]|nr:S-layer homology domain-containing protein [Clostridiales bacterium]
MKIFKKAASFALALVITAGATAINSWAAEGLENGTYTVATATSYLNPDTGKTDDGGTANTELGEGMCRSAVYEKAVIEQTDEGAVITMRMLLYSNLSNIRFAVQTEPKGSYEDVTYVILKESSSNDSADIKFTATSADSYIRVQMYVAPMGRDVCFYWNCDLSTAEVSDGSLDQQEEKEEITAEEPGDKLTDISGHWAESEIKSVVNKGLFSGTTQITFEPDSSMTRGMFVTVLGRLSGEEISGSCTFSDVDNSKYYAPYIAWANENGIVNGMSETTFSPDSPVTCEQAAIILVKYAAYKGTALETKSISPSTTGVSEWAKENVITAGKAGIITKQNTNGYDYTSAATRADVASMISNYSEYYGN